MPKSILILCSLKISVTFTSEKDKLINVLMGNISMDDNKRI